MQDVNLHEKGGTRQLVPEEGSSTQVPATTAEPAGKRIDLGYDHQGNVILATNEHGLPTEIAKEMHQSADGFDAPLSMMQASSILQEMPVDFAQHFKTLSESIKIKA